MLRKSLSLLLIASLALTVVPNAAAAEGPYECVQNGVRECDGPLDWVKRIVDRVDPSPELCFKTLDTCVAVGIQDPKQTVEDIKDLIIGPCTCPPQD